MSKYDQVLRADYVPPGAVDNKGGGIIDGRMLMIGSVGADKISIRELSDLIQAMGTLKTGTIHLGQAERSFLRMTSEPVPRLELRDPQGRYVVVFDANSLNGVTVAMGIPDANGVHPFRIPAATGDIEIRSRVIIAGPVAQTLLTSDYIWVGTGFQTAYAYGVLLDATGLVGIKANQQSARFDASRGEFIAGQYDQVVLNEDGLVGIVQVDNPQGWTFREGSVVGSTMGAILATVDPDTASPRDVDINIYAIQPGTGYRANMSIWAFNQLATGYALLQLSSHDIGTSHNITAWLFAPDLVKLTSGAIELDGNVVIPSSYNLRSTYGVIKGKLALHADHIGMTSYAWEQTEVGTLAVVLDSTGVPYLRIKRQSIDGITVHEYIVKMTEVEI